MDGQRRWAQIAKELSFAPNSASRVKMLYTKWLLPFIKDLNVSNNNEKYGFNFQLGCYLG